MTKHMTGTRDEWLAALLELPKAEQELTRRHDGVRQRAASRKHGRSDRRVHMRIGVIGAAGMGSTLARNLGRLGHDVSIANSRGPESLTALAAEIGATPASVVDAAKAGEIVIIAIPTKAVADLPRGLFANVPSSVVVIDVGNYHPELRDGRIDAIDRGCSIASGSRSRSGVP